MQKLLCLLLFVLLGFFYNRNHCKCITIHICNNYVQLTVQSDSRELIRKTHRIISAFIF